MYKADAKVSRDILYHLLYGKKFHFHFHENGSKMQIDDNPSFVITWPLGWSDFAEKN